MPKTEHRKKLNAHTCMNVALQKCRAAKYICLKVLIIFINKNLQYMPYRKVNLSVHIIYLVKVWLLN